MNLSPVSSRKTPQPQRGRAWNSVQFHRYFRVDLGLLAGQIPPAQGLCPLVQLRLPGELDGGLRWQRAADSGAQIGGGEKRGVGTGLFRGGLGRIQLRNTGATDEERCEA